MQCTGLANSIRSYFRTSNFMYHFTKRLQHLWDYDPIAPGYHWGFLSPKPSRTLVVEILNTPRVWFVGKRDGR